MTASFGARLAQVVADRGSLCVGIDPHPSVLVRWGLEATVAGLEACARGMVEALGDQVAVFKPQSAFYESYGSAGVAVLERLLADIAQTGALSLLDIKRGDIGSTMDAYTAAYLSDGSALAADAVTLSPYLGFGSLTGAIAKAAETGRGVFILALTSNPEGAQVQHARTSAGLTVGQEIVNEAAAINAQRADQSVPGHVGIVAGATIGETGTDFSALAGPILAPGIGAQGGTAEDLARTFGSARSLVLPSTSREILNAGPDRQALRDSVTTVLTQMNSVAGLG